MHMFNMAAIFIVVSLVGIEFSVSAFVYPAARLLQFEPQRTILGRVAAVFGKVMPIWYPACALLLGVEVWLYWRAPERNVLLAALAIWVLASLASIIFLVPMNTRIAQGNADWQRISRIWDKRHRARVAALAVSAVLLMYAVVR